MTEKCRKSLEHKQDAMEEARVKAVLPVPKTTPTAWLQRRSNGAALISCTIVMLIEHFTAKKKAREGEQKHTFLVLDTNLLQCFNPYILLLTW